MLSSDDYLYVPVYSRTNARPENSMTRQVLCRQHGEATLTRLFKPAERMFGFGYLLTGVLASLHLTASVVR
jgi:hypothetical protein